MLTLEEQAIIEMSYAHEKSSQNNFGKCNISSTSNTGEDFKAAYPAPIQHQPTLERDALIDSYEEKGKTKLVPKIESRAALIVQETLTGYLSLDADSRTWHRFTGTHWVPDNEAIDSVLIELLYPGTESLGFKTSYKNGIKSILVDGNLMPLPKNDAGKLPFFNGLLCLKTKRLEPITPKNAQTWCLPYEFEPGLDCPSIKAWLLQAVDGDGETIEFLRAWMSAVLHGRNDLQKFLHLKGSGGTGKGMFIRLLTALIGKDNAAITSLGQLEQNRFEAATLYNKRLAVISESDRYGGSINVLKAITGQDDIRLERKHQQQAGSFVFQGLVIMASNESLQTTDHTSGLDRRRITVIFNRRASDEEKQKWERQGGEGAVLHRELPGLVNWLLELSQDDISRIIRNPPERIRNADFNAMTATNPVAAWIEECCIADREAWTQIGDKREIREPGHETIYENGDKWLYANFLQWCQRANKPALASRRFTETLIQTCTTLGFHVAESRRNSGNGIIGLRIRQELSSGEGENAAF